MKIRLTRSCCCFVQIALVASALAHPTYSPAEAKRAKTDRDINAIGRRVIGYPTGRNNWYSLAKEEELGNQVSAAFEKSVPLMRDSATDSYLDRLLNVIGQNSDAKLPLTIRIIDSDESYAVTLLGGHQYLTRGLLLKLQNEGELAAAIARGGAHTALRSATGELTRANLLNLTNLPSVSAGRGAGGNSTADPAFGNALAGLSFRRQDESAADYFGIQYLYKSGYAPECFISFIEKVWPPSSTTAQAFSPFAPLQDRLNALQKEIREILPPQGGAITDTEDFESFRKHLAGLPPPKPLPKQPILIRSDSQESK